VVIGRFRSGSRRRDGEDGDMAVEAARGRFLVEESPEIVLVLDDQDVVVAASRRARDSLGRVIEGERLPPELLHEDAERMPVIVPYQVDGRNERLVYLSSRSGELAAYEELRAGFTAAVSHELRTPLARLLALLESADLPGADLQALLGQAREEVQEMTELVDDILFLSELEQEREVVSLGDTEAAPVLRELVAEFAERAELAGISVQLRIEDEELHLPLRRRMLRLVAENLLVNVIRYAGEGATCTISLRSEDGNGVLEVSDDGAGVPDEDVPRLFERFFRSDRARTTRGSGLGLAIVKHVIEAAGGNVEARGGQGRGLDVRCSLPS
jgi:two-component system, OmpR family, phosphate regulon sensor histidine kinase PhoR